MCGAAIHVIGSCTRTSEYRYGTLFYDSSSERFDVPLHYTILCQGDKGAKAEKQAQTPARTPSPRTSVVRSDEDCRPLEVVDDWVIKLVRHHVV